MAAGRQILASRAKTFLVLAIARVERRKYADKPIHVRGIDFDQGVDVESRNRGALEYGCNAADHDVLDAVLLKELEDPEEALCRHRGVPR
ncbi:MAG TPA: hypothetical protein VFY39_00055 [Gammaproteobacteria bacterium]|nr:hypothetical protein [Gammaproteobacteria bacterium]